MNKKYDSFYGLIIVIVLWYLLHWFVDSRIIPYPHETILNTIDLILNEGLLKHIIYSLYRLTVAVGMAIIFGSGLGILLGISRKLDKIISPALFILFPVPKAAFLPIFFVLFGLGDKSKIILIFTILVFQVIVTIRDSVKNLSEDIFLSAKSLGLKKLDVYRHVILPGILPSILTSLRLSIGIGIAVLFFAETYATKFGIGYFVMDSWSLIEYVDMYSGIVMLSVMGYLIFKSIDFIENKVCKWAKK